MTPALVDLLPVANIMMYLLGIFFVFLSIVLLGKFFDVRVLARLYDDMDYAVDCLLLNLYIGLLVLILIFSIGLHYEFGLVIFGSMIVTASMSVIMVLVAFKCVYNFVYEYMWDLHLKIKHKRGN